MLILDVSWKHQVNVTLTDNDSVSLLCIIASNFTFHSRTESDKRYYYISLVMCLIFTKLHPITKKHINLLEWSSEFLSEKFRSNDIKLS